MSTPELAVAVELAPPLSPQALEAVLLSGDLSKLSAADRLTYYRRVCESVGLNPLTQPLQYIVLNGKLTLYARRDCTEQLRKLHGVSVRDMTTELIGDVYVVRATLVDKSGRTDQSTGAVPIKGLSGENLANAYMKAETKCKRRGTLSICGLGMLDETEIDSIPGAKPEGPPKQPFLPPRRIESKGGDATAPGNHGDTGHPVTTPTKGGDAEPDESPLTDEELAALDAQDAKEADAETPPTEPVNPYQVPLGPSHNPVGTCLVCNPDGGGPCRFITPAQVRRLYALIQAACEKRPKAVELLRSALHVKLMQTIGVKEFERIPKRLYNEVCDKWVTAGGPWALKHEQSA